MTISHYEPPTGELAPLPDDDGIARWTRILPAAAMLADRIANTEFVSGAMRGKPDVITAAILYGDEIGVGPMSSYLCPQ